MEQTQAQFEQFMAAQMEAMMASGLDPEEWVEQFAAQFRADYEAQQTVH